MVETGKPGILGSGTKRRWSMCCSVFGHLMQRTACLRVNLML